jgi:hypothetical protein
MPEMTTSGSPLSSLQTLWIWFQGDEIINKFKLITNTNLNAIALRTMGCTGIGKLTTLRFHVLQTPLVMMTYTIKDEEKNKEINE